MAGEPWTSGSNESSSRALTPPSVPPPPTKAPPTALPPLAAWLRTPRPEAGPGIWRCGYEPRSPKDLDQTPTRRLVVGALASAFLCWALISLLWDGYLGDYWVWPYVAIMPDSTRGDMIWVIGSWVYALGITFGIVIFFARLGRLPELGRRALQRAQQAPQPTGAPPPPRHHPTPPPEQDPVHWPHLRAAGAEQAADRLRDELLAGALSDVDQARLERAWQVARSQQNVEAFVREVVSKGAAACPHGSRQRDVSARVALHDLVLRQVRIGQATDSDRNPYQYRGAGIALDPGVLGTSALVVGPAGSGKTARVVRPVVESLCLQALSGQAAVIYVTTGSVNRTAPADDAFDVVVGVGDPDSVYGLDLYGGVTDPDEAATLLAEALVGDLTTSPAGGDSRRAATLLAQLIGPYQAVHARFPDVPELRELLHDDAAVGELRSALESKGRRGSTWVRELDAYRRQARSGTLDSVLEDRIALLDRPIFEDFFTAPGSPPARRRPFSVRALDRPVRARIDLPERGHAEASRILARLLLAQFSACAAARPDRSLFAALVLDDASQTVTPNALRGLQQLRSAHAGVLLTLRGLDEVPEHLRSSLLGAVGCRAVCAGVSPWDAERFAEAWGTEWVETRTVTNRQLVSDEPMTKVLHGLRKMATGRYVSAESVTVRQEQRQRWSASELANELPPGHAVLSMTTVRGERTPPVLTNLNG
ncbi:ATP-binding protein [Streptomyces spirodelae]|uniref:ATP-binding protein n=1 Tax=Streptomyces spirodelae TaxID=2812904 RepID=A0ABS3X1D1_9ACTN|nr:ATP-binding protein [Streptomyces spirodelae]MBO8189185.1 ATP-binding protein [Streptomyces spirodelae]